MPRSGDGTYSLPPGTAAVPNQIIESSKYNTLTQDLAADNNNPRPISSGGTGATNPTDARAALGLEIGGDIQPFDPNTALTDTIQSWTAVQNFNANLTVGNRVGIRSWDDTDPDIDGLLPGSTNGYIIETVGVGQNVIGLKTNATNDGLYVIADLDNDGLYDALLLTVRNNAFQYKGNEVWHAGNFDPADKVNVSDIGVTVQARNFALDAISALTTHPWGRDLLTLNAASALQAYADLEPGTDVQTHSAALDTYAANSLNTGQLTQLGNIGAVSITETEWNRVASINTAATQSVGTSGGSLGLLNANKTDSGANTFTGFNIFEGALSLRGNVSLISDASLGNGDEDTITACGGGHVLYYADSGLSGASAGKINVSTSGPSGTPADGERWVQREA